MIINVSERNLSRLVAGNNYNNSWEKKPGVFQILVRTPRQGVVLHKLGLLQPVKTQTLRNMEKVRTNNYVGLKNHRGRVKYVLRVQPNSSAYLVNVNTRNVKKINLNKVFTQRQKQKINLNEFINQVRVKKVNHTNKTDPVSLHNFRPGEYAYGVKTGPKTVYYQPSTVRRLTNMNMNTTLGSQIMFNNPLTRQPVKRKNITKVRMVKPHKVRSTR